MKKIRFTLFLVLSSLNIMAQSDDYQKGVGYYNNGDYKNAYIYLLKSANSGNMYAQVLLGNMYGFALGIGLDFAIAFDWYSKAANQGNADAQCKYQLHMSTSITIATTNVLSLG
jgi:TPR repeat protein